MPVSRTALALCFSVLTLTAAVPALGQCTIFSPPTECPAPEPMTCPDDVLGDFCDAEAWFVGPGGLGGVLRSGNQIQVDQTCDGDVNDAADLTFNLPSSITQLLSSCAACSIEFRLSPSQDTLHVRVLSTSVTVPGCGFGQVRAFFFALDTPPTLVPFSGVNNGACLNNIAVGPVFYDRPADPVRTAVMVAGASGGRHAVMWADLVGRAVGLDTISYPQGVQWPQFSQRGNAAFIRSISGGQTTHYAVIDLCRSPIGASGAISSGPFPGGATGVAAEIVGDTDSLIAVVTHNGGDIDVSLDNCLCGACCDGGGCAAETAASDCAGTFFPEADCAPDPCSGSAPEACCLAGGACTSLTSSDCISAGGTPHPGMTCAASPCTVATEACCDPLTGACSDIEPAACTSTGGIPSGPGSTCADTSCPAPAGTQACCLGSGGCVNLPPVGSFPSCAALSGAAQGPGTNCLNASFSCPTAELTITKSGPASVRQGEAFTYTISYGNLGPDDSGGVQVVDTIPTGTTFISASATPGGTPATVSGGTVTWAVGALPAGSTGQQVTLTVRAGCNTSVVNNNYRITGAPGGTAMGAAVTTSVTAGSTDPITLAVSSIDLNGPPLVADDVVEHTFTLTNTVAEPRDGIVVGGLTTGNILSGFISTFDTTVDAAGGSFIVLSGGSSFRWEGSLAPSATNVVVFTTRVIACIPAGHDREILNFGGPIGVRGPCGQALGSATPTDEFETARPIDVELRAINLTGRGTQVVREGGDLEFEITLTERLNVDHAAITASLVIPIGIVPDPEFNPLISPPAGTTYDAALRTISYNAPVAAGDIVTIRWNGVLEPAAPCGFQVNVTGSIGTCNNVSGGMRLLRVPVMPLGPHIIGLDEFGINQGLWMLELGATPLMRDLLCIHGELFTGLDRSPDGEIWFTDVIGQLMRFNPQTEPPQLESFDDDVISNEVLLSSLNDVAVDPTLAERNVILVGQGGVRRFYPDRPVGQRVDVIVDSGPEPLRVSVDPEGMIAAMSPDGLVRIDPSGPLPLAPGDYAQFNVTVPGDLGGLIGTRTQSLSNLAIDLDGDYLVTVITDFVEDFGHPTTLPLRFTSVASLLKIDRTSGALGAPGGTPTVVVERLAGTVTCFGGCPTNPPPANLSDAMFPGDDLSFALAADVDSNGAVHIGSERFSNRVFVVHRGGGAPTGQLLEPTGPTSHSVTDMAIVDSATPPQLPGDLDADGDVDADDFELFSDAFGSDSGDPAYDPTADLNHDGTIDCDDWELFRDAWSPGIPFFRPCLRRLTPGDINPATARGTGEYGSQAKSGYCGAGAAMLLAVCPMAWLCRGVRRLRSAPIRTPHGSGGPER